jgi:shikimate kinase
MTLWLIGMMGSGKTAAGRIAAGRLGVPFFDTDDEVVSDVGHPIARIWDETGETAFRQMESAAMRRLADEEAVISTGGGVVLDEENRVLMRKSGVVVWLRCAPEVLAARLGGSTGRPLLDQEPDRAAALAGVLESRAAAYSETADYEIDTSFLSVEEVARGIEGLWPS